MRMMSLSVSAGSEMPVLISMSDSRPDLVETGMGQRV